MRLALGILIICGSCFAQDARALVAKAVTADNRSDRLARDYTYKVKDEIIEYDSAGRIKATHTTVDEVLYIAGKQYLHLLEKDGKPLPDTEQRKEQAKLDRAVADAARLTTAERARRIAAAEQDRAKRRAEFKDIPDAFNFKLLGDSEVDGRPAWQIQATPRSAYRGNLHAILNNVEGTLWIDKSDLIWVRFEADVLKPFGLGWFLARVGQGSHVSYHMTRVNDELWVPAGISLKASARLVLLKKLNVEQNVSFSDYRKFQTDSRIVSTEETQ